MLAIVNGSLNKVAVTKNEMLRAFVGSIAAKNDTFADNSDGVNKGSPQAVHIKNVGTAITTKDTIDDSREKLTTSVVFASIKLLATKSMKIFVAIIDKPNTPKTLMVIGSAARLIRLDAKHAITQMLVIIYITGITPSAILKAVIAAAKRTAPIPRPTAANTETPAARRLANAIAAADCKAIIINPKPKASAMPIYTIDKTVKAPGMAKLIIIPNAIKDPINTANMIPYFSNIFITNSFILAPVLGL